MQALNETIDKWPIIGLGILFAYSWLVLAGLAKIVKAWKSDT